MSQWQDTHNALVAYLSIAVEEFHIVKRISKDILYV